MATGNHIPNFHFAQGNLYYSVSAVTYAAAAAISANAVVTNANQVIQCKNLSFTPPKGEVEVINLMGEESTTTGAGVPSTGAFQNQCYDFKAWTDATLTCTLVWTAHNDGGSSNLLPDFVELVTGDGQAISTTYHRHTFGDSTSGQTRTTVGSVIIVMDNGVQESALAMNNVVVNLGEIKPTGDDGHYEMDVEIKCLPKDAVLEIKDND